MEILHLAVGVFFTFSDQSRIHFAWLHWNAFKEALMLIYHITRKCEVEVHSRQILEMFFNKEEESRSMLVHQASSFLWFIDCLNHWDIDIDMFRRIPFHCINIIKSVLISSVMWFIILLQNSTPQKFITYSWKEETAFNYTTVLSPMISYLIYRSC